MGNTIQDQISLPSDHNNPTPWSKRGGSAAVGVLGVCKSVATKVVNVSFPAQSFYQLQL